ncbi:HindVP family restriction endonuclease [soil metagenome]
MGSSSEPSLLGLGGRSNRDFSLKEAWGKNQFNNCFPASLAFYMHRENLEPVYLTLGEDFEVRHGKVSVAEVFGMNPSSENLFFGFESQFTPYHPMVVGRLPRADLVTMDISGGGGRCLRDVEIKLTALPDSSTVERPDSGQSSEIVVRPDTIVYAALSMAKLFEGRRKELSELLGSERYEGVDWRSSEDVRPLVPDLANDLDRVLGSEVGRQSPLMMQPVWKTVGKTLALHEQCFDIFVWSDFALTRLFLDRAKSQAREQMTREMRSVVWIVKMLHDFASTGKMNPGKTTNEIVYAPRNDKAFAISGSRTLRYLESPELARPRIKRSAVKEIVLGGGEKHLSPERRLDAVVQSTFDLL